MRNIKTKIFSIFAAASVILSGCQSIQKNISLSRADEKTLLAVAEIEEAVIKQDGFGASREGIAGVRQQIAILEKTVADNDFQAVLAAWSGRLYLMEGKISDAQREYRKSQSLSPLNLPSRILSLRLERDLSMRLALVDQSLKSEGSAGELLAERGRTLFDMNRFSESVAAFDAAFITLMEKPFYEEAYGAFRGKAWELRDLEQGTGSMTVEIASRREITWKELIEITKTETDFFRFITAGRDWPAESLFAQLTDRAFIPLTQDVTRTEWPFSKPSSSETVFRSGAAWFLWHINAENRANRGLLTQYSSRYANTSNARSPIGDLAVSSPFLDSILGCVETEFMSLPDGRNFMPNEPVKGSEFLSMLKKL
jgi:tetratricopeptide (TPR) repeat protein